MKKMLLKLFTAFSLAILLATTVFSAEFVFIEAESGKMDSMSEVADAEAYGGKYITSGDVEESADYTFEIPKDGKYTAWFRVYATSDTDNSIFFSVDGDTYNDEDSQWIFDFREASEYEVSPDEKYLDPDYNNADVCYDRWYWIRMSYRDASADPVTRFNTKLYDFTAGTHTLHIQAREAGGRIDKFFFTDDLDYNPNNVTGDPEAEIIAKNASVVADEEPVVTESTDIAVDVPTAPNEEEIVTAPSTGNSYNILFVGLFASSALIVAVIIKKRRVN